MAVAMDKVSLPGDLIEEILSRVPAKSLVRFQSTSRRWKALLKSSRRFAKKHSANAPKEESLSIMLIDHRVCLVKINLHGIHNNLDPSVKVAYQFSLEDPRYKSQVDIRNIIHCDGLLLCTTQDKGLVVWNPCSGEIKWIKPRDSYKATDFYALGYDNKSSCKQYKILRMDSYNIEYEVYDFTSDSWKVLSSVTTTDWFLQSQHGGGMSMKGNTYWVAVRPHSIFLLSFDFSTERFQSLSLPHPCIAAALSVVREEKLFLLGSPCNDDEDDASTRDLHVWVTSNPGSVTSWTKFLTVKDNHEEYINDFYNGLSFLADTQNKSLVCCNYFWNLHIILRIVGENKDVQHVLYNDHPSFTNRPSYQLLLDYVPSLVRIQQCTLPRGRKRKSQTM